MSTSKGIEKMLRNNLTKDRQDVCSANLHNIVKDILRKCKD